MSKRNEEIINELSLFIDPICELDFRNNYELICAVMLSAQTTDKSVNLVSPELFRRYSNLDELSKANPNDIEPIIRSIGLSKNKSMNLVKMANAIIDNYNGDIPNTIEDLITLPGVGRKTASVVLALGFKIPAFPVDTHVSRVSKRLKMSNEDDDVLKIEEKLKKSIPKDMWIDAHHLMLLFGRYYCTSKNPKCDGCRMKRFCKNIKAL